MGKIIAFWSPYQGTSKVTSSLCAVAGAFGLLYPELHVAISRTKQGGTELEGKLDYRAGPQKSLYEKSGLTALALNYMQSVLTTEKIMRCAIPLQMESLFLFPGEESKSGLSDVMFRVITEYLVKEFPFIFMDVESGHGEKSERFLKAADLTVIVLPHAKDIWEHFFLEEAEWLEKRNYCVLISGYLKESRYGINYLKQRKEDKIKEVLAGVIPINTGFMDAMQEGKTLDYFFRNQLSRKKEENYEFMVQTKKATEAIKKRIFLS